MFNINLFAAISAFFNMFTTSAVAANRIASSVDNIAKLGENYTNNLVVEQEIIQKQRVKDMNSKMTKKYKAEKQNWEANL